MGKEVSERHRKIALKWLGLLRSRLREKDHTGILKRNGESSKRHEIDVKRSPSDS